MRIPELLLALVLAIAALLGAAMWLGDVGTTPTPHPEHPGILRGGGGIGTAALWLG